MRNYIIINGQSSAEIEGLIIERLAPISKPQQRTNVITVDGRDGDIITPLGYSAYDKSITIGLSYNYDVDQVIEYFNQSGTIIFSNEPDKYYKFAIYEQIDLERLIRFKRAIVTLHVQPFKYSESETDIVNIYPDNTTMASISVRNSGNVYSKPTITIKGKGNISVALGNTQLFSIVLPSASLNTIIIDSAEMNAYNEDGVFMNRAVTGDYSNFIFKVGLNNLTINGDISEVIISKYSRWI